MNKSHNEKIFSETVLKEDSTVAGLEKELDPIDHLEIMRKFEEDIFSIKSYERDALLFKDALGERKKGFIDKLSEANKIHLVNILFGLEELMLRNKIAEKNKIRTEDMKIEDAKLQQEIAYFIGDNEKDFKLLGNFWDEYEKIFENNGDKTSNTLKHGILAPIALKNILESKYNGKDKKRLEFIYSTPEDDVKKSIDMIAIDNKNKLNLLIQVKGDALSREELEEMVKRVASFKSNNQVNKDKEKMELVTIINERDFSGRDTSIGKKLNDFNAGCSKYFAEHEKTLKESGAKTVGIYIYVPSVVGGEVWIDLNGHPNKKLSNLISGMLDLKMGIA